MKEYYRCVVLEAKTWPSAKAHTWMCLAGNPKPDKLVTQNDTQTINYNRIAEPFLSDIFLK